MRSLTFDGLLHDGATLLCLGAHSDDLEIGCGGTLLKLLDRHPGLRVHWVVFSSDEQRAREANESAIAFLAGAKSVEITIKAFRNGYFPYVADRIKDDFEALKRNVAPDLIFTHHENDAHQDHRLISQLTWNTFRSHLILEYEIPKYDGDLGRPNVFSCLDEASSQRKIDIIMQCFESQRDKQWFDADLFRALLRLRGMESDSPTRLAEAFYCRKLVLG
jgi:LmbE family N-acetylglucosaminyl deacetylase